MSSHNPLTLLRRLDTSSSTFHDQVSNILYGEEYKRWKPGVQGDDLVGLVDYLDEVLDALDPTGLTFRKCLQELRHICGARAILPRSSTVLSQALTPDQLPVASGGSADVYKGSLNGSTVCIKRFRVYSKDGPRKATRAFCQEAAVWKHLEHKNIVRLLGVTSAPLQLVSEWIPGGDLTEYVKKHPGADRLGLLSCVADGLHYLHSRDIVHGDLKGSNILMDATNNARITGFGLTTVTRNLDSARGTTGDLVYSARWTAPEILEGKVIRSKEADIFSFAMVMIEVFTGAIPFDDRTHLVATAAILTGKRPPRPTDPTFTDELWALMGRCWHRHPHVRPQVSEVLKGLRGPPSPVKLPGPRFGCDLWRLRGGPAGRDPVAPDPPPLRITVSPSPPPTLRIRSLGVGYGSVGPVSPGNRGESVGADESQDARPHASPKEMLQHPPLGAGDNRSGSDLVSPENCDWVARTDEGPNEKLHPSPRATLQDPSYSVSGTDLQDTLSSGSALRVGVSDKRSDFNYGSEGCVSATQEDDLDDFEASGDRYHQGGEDRNPSPTFLCRATPSTSARSQTTVHLLNDPSADHLGHDQSTAYLYYGGKGVDFQNTDDGVLPGRESVQGTSGTNVGNTADDASHWETGSQSRNQSCVGVSEMVSEDREIPLPQTHQDQRESLQDPEQHTRASGPRTGGGPQGDRECEAKNDSGDTLDHLDSLTWNGLIRKTLTTRERVYLITTIFTDYNQVEILRCLSQGDAQTFIDMTDEVMNDLAPQIRKKFLYVVYRICGRQALVPRSLEIPLCYDPNEQPVCYGGFADVWKGRHRGKEVAAKVLRLRRKDDLEQIRRSFCKEVVGWKTLCHPNVLPLLGVTMTNGRLVMVSEWMTNGNINEFVKANINADRLKLVRDVTKGLIYMHDQGIIHGDLKGANILINNSGHACLADFSFLTMASDQTTLVTSCAEGGTIPWMSPELLDPEPFDLKKSRPTKQSDCYALGMVIYEVLSGRTPFFPSKPFAIIGKVLKGERPVRPGGEGGKLFTDIIWEQLQLSWEHQPSNRPNAKAVLLCLEGDPPSAWPPSSAYERLVTISNDSDPPPLRPLPSASANGFMAGGVTEHECLKEESKELRGKVVEGRGKRLKREKKKVVEMVEEAAGRAEGTRKEEPPISTGNATTQNRFQGCDLTLTFEPPEPTPPMTISSVLNAPRPEEHENKCYSCF